MTQEVAHPVLSPSQAEWRIEGLAAQGPDPELKEKLMLFGQFVGDWDILECRYLGDDGKWTSEKGRIHWRWILDGRALQDVWSTIDKESGKEVPGGTTVRFYDEKIDAWRSTWISPSQGAVKAFIGRQAGNEIALDGKNEEGQPIKWIFSEVTKNSFRWRAEVRINGGGTWTMYEEMRIRRRGDL